MDEQVLPDVEALLLAGARRLEAQDPPGAAACYRRALELAPDLAEAQVNLGVALEKGGAVGEAEACYARALALDPDQLDATLNLGALLVRQKRFEAAGACYARALERHPDAAALWSNVGVLQACLQQFEAAERCCRTALALAPDYAKARYNLSYLLLRQGRFEEGWAALEARAWSLALTDQIPGPRWQGESLAGRSLLIGPEAGFGDMIQFARYVPLLKDLGAARVGIVCPPALKRLFATLPGIDAVVAAGEAIPELGWELWTLPLSLPHHCGTRLDTIPASIPYLQAAPEQVSAWRTRLPAGALKVGLAWKGNPRFENDADRSLPGLEVLAPLAAVVGVCFVSLQQGVTEPEAASLPPGLALVDPGPWISDFADTAALMAGLDLVISVDTAAAHLAGALGRPCWVLLPHYKTDWRWLTGRTDSPWYPGTMRLFRQGEGGDWSPVIAAVALALETFLAGRPSAAAGA